MAGTVDLTTSGTFGAVGDGLFMTGNFQLDTSGGFVSVVRMQAPGSEHGYNTDAVPQFNEKDAHTTSLLLSDIPIVYGNGEGGTAEGVAYREFVFRLNDPNGTKSTISFDEFQIWQQDAGNLTNFTPDAGFASTSNDVLIYDLDAGGNAWVALNDDVPEVNGSGDVRVLIPDSMFVQDALHRYVTIYSAFGLQGGIWSADGGDDDWGVNTVNEIPNSDLSVLMNATVPGGTVDQVGEVITYNITLSNMGAAAQTNVVVTDSLDTVLTRGLDAIGNNDAVLDVGEMWTYTAQYTATQQDIDSAVGGGSQITNTVTADSAQTIPDVAHSTVAVEYSPAITLTKTATVADGAADEAGDVISFAISVTNESTVTLTNPVLTDSAFIATPVLDFSAPILAPGVPLLTPVFEGDYNIGDDNNNGVVDLTDHNGIEDPGETFVYFNVGDDNQNGTEDPGETFQFTQYNAGDTNQNTNQDDGETFQYYNAGDANHDGVENNGEEFQYTLTPVVPSHVDADNDGFNDGDVNEDGKLSVGETWNYTTPSYTLTQADIDNRDANGVPTVLAGLSHDNTASVDTDQDASASDTEVVAIVQNPDLAIVKTVTAINGNAGQQSVTAAGQVIDYAITVDNTGNMTLTGLQVTDTLDPTVQAVVAGDYNIGDVNQDGELDLDETWTFQASYAVTQDDIDNRVAGVPTVIASLTKNNTATADTAQTAPESASVAAPVVQNPDLAIVKTVSAINGNAGQQTVTAAGQAIDYAITVQNTGNMTLTGLQVTDTLDPTVVAVVAGGFNVGDASQDGELDVGETWSFAASYTVTQDDIDNRVSGVPTLNASLSKQNTATADTAQTLPENASASVPIAQAPAVAVTKTADVTTVNPGGVINYTVQVDNTGNMTLTGVAVSDPLTPLSLTSGDTDNDGALDVNETWVYTGSYTAQEADFTSNGGGDGDIDNTATVTTAQGAGGSANASVLLDLNDAPVNSVPANGFATAFSDTDFAITGISVADVDAGTGAIRTTVSAVNGGLTFDLSGGAAVAAGVNGSSTVTLEGTVAQVNAALSTLVYNSDDGFTGTETISVTTNDQGNTGAGGPLSDSDSFSIGVVPQVWYIDNTQNNTAPGSGTKLDPFTSIEAFNDATETADGPGPNDYILVTGDYVGEGLNLDDGQKVYGADQVLQFTDPVSGNPVVVSNGSGDRPTITVTAGDQGVDLASGNTIHGLNVVTQDSTATGIDDGSGANDVGTLVITNVSVTGAGKAIDIDGGGTLNVALGTVSSSSSASEGVDLTGVSGTVTASSGAIAGSALTAFNVSGGSVSVTYGGSIAKDSDGNAITVSNQTGGTVSFNGTVSSTGASDGIGLQNNSGATVSFTNTLTLDTSASGTAAFSATGGGSVNASGSGSTINSGAGTALNVVNTTIGASDLTFQSISANGAANGIVLNNTGTSGGLIVTGDGADAGTAPDSLTSGGTIQNATGDGIVLTSTQDVYLGGMTITSNDGSGIRGTSVNGFVLDTVSITGNGNQTSPDESGVELINLSGTTAGGLHATEIRNSTISNSHEVEVQITNSTGTLADFRIVNSTLSSNGATGVHGNLLNFLATGTANMTLTVSGSTFTGNTVAGALTGNAIFADASGGSINVDVGTSTFTNNNVGVGVSAATSGTATFDIHDNTITGTRANGIHIFTNANATGQVTGKIQDNIVGTQGVAGSGSALGRGIQVALEGAGTATLLIDDNTVQSVAQFEGISVNDSVVATTTNLTVTDNILRDIAADRGITVQTTVAGGTMNANISGNSFINVAGLPGDPNQAALRVREQTGSDVNVVQLAATAAVNANELDDANNLPNTRVSISGTLDYGQPAPPTPLLAASGGIEAAAVPASVSHNLAAGEENLTLTGSGDDSVKGNELDNVLTGNAGDNRLNGGNGGHDRLTGGDGVDTFVFGDLDGVDRVTDFENGRDRIDVSAVDGVASFDDLNLVQTEGGLFVGYGTGGMLLAGVSESSLDAKDFVFRDELQASQVVADDGVLSQAELDFMVAAAISRWEEAGASAEQIAALESVDFTIADLSGAQLGSSEAGQVVIDADAADYGWFIDRTPDDDFEFGNALAPTQLQTDPYGAPAGDLDLLTAVMHEMGHQLGLGDLDAAADSGDLMFSQLVTGERRLPDADLIA